MINPNKTIIVYGSYGYTGTLIVSECKLRGHNVILAGRSKEALEQQHSITGFDYYVIDISDTSALSDLLSKGSVLINCAGPFQQSARKMVECCLETKIHYTDITGEHQVFELLAKYNQQAVKAGITIVPGCGFDVVPSDCLAAHLKQRLPSATTLQLAFSMKNGGVSRGTAKTMVEGLGYGSQIRKEGSLVTVPFGEKVLTINFGSHTTNALNIPWGDIVTAWQSTAIPNIEVYMGAKDKLIRLAALSKYIDPVLRIRAVKKFLLRYVDRNIKGPLAQTRSQGRCYLWGKVSDGTGNIHISILETMNGYNLTAQTSTAVAGKIIEGNFKTGYHTPSMAYGADLILEFESTIRKDIQ